MSYPRTAPNVAKDKGILDNVILDENMKYSSIPNTKLALLRYIVKIDAGEMNYTMINPAIVGGSLHTFTILGDTALDAEVSCPIYGNASGTFTVYMMKASPVDIYIQFTILKAYS